jgi:hypothetical protein
MRALLAYDPDTGIFTWRVRMNARAHAGSLAGRNGPHAFWVIRFDGQIYMAHRLA